MLLEFTVGNFLSFKEKKTFSLEAGSITEHKDNVVKDGKYKVLRSAVIYGANSSGKSNFIKALDFMIETIKNSSRLNSTDKLKAKPFLLNTETENKPSFFEILFLKNKARYRYGFELDNDKIYSEWLYISKENSKKEDVYFVRNIDGIGVGDIFVEAKGLEEKTRNNGLFISVADQFNSKIAKDIMDSTIGFFILSGLEHEGSIYATDFMCENESNKTLVNNFIKKLDLGFESFIIESDDKVNFKHRLKTLHNKYDNKGNLISNMQFRMIENESSGTNKIFDLSGHIVFAIKLGCVLIVDELDAKLHPVLTQEIINFFNNPITNPKNAQLIFTTHDTNLLGANLFRRDQIWFTEKDNFEATDMYSLLEFKDEDGKTIRKDRSFEADYIRGRYGAIPYISNLQEI
ncbi:ATP-binding protein [Flavobacterium sp. MMLR14_040]|uniref:AAA family ATPase n=1 Tax=Flavobacterium sp. MMLR14_040 TaxID=3093843 RepID=UPI00298FFECA|nr:ATP-binding protein [Flavobacterium sp. MMLR14_040]MDW8851790.1 ATP-binding protein [Flavobacterium sp. MMLR14_040]